jgi:hypothetical protein
MKIHHHKTKDCSYWLNFTGMCLFGPVPRLFKHTNRCRFHKYKYNSSAINSKGSMSLSRGYFEYFDEKQESKQNQALSEEENH